MSVNFIKMLTEMYKRFLHFIIYKLYLHNTYFERHEVKYADTHMSNVISKKEGHCFI
jgi:hypothetical protein